MDVGGYLQAFESDVAEVQDLLSPDLVGDKRAVGDDQREDFYLEYLEAIVGSYHVTTATRRPNPRIHSCPRSLFEPQEPPYH